MLKNIKNKVSKKKSFCMTSFYNKNLKNGYDDSIIYIVNQNTGVYLVSTVFQKYKQRVVEMPGHLKRHKLKINADNKELAFAA